MKKLLLPLGAILSTLVTSWAPAHGQATTTETKPVITGKIGGMYDLRSHSWTSVRQFTYAEQPVGKQGKDLPSFTPADPFFSSADGDSTTSPFTLKLEEGKGFVSGGYAKLFKKNPFDFAPIRPKGFYSVGRIGGDFDAKQINVLYGLERPVQLRKLGLGNGANLANNLLLGLGGEYRSRKGDNSEDKLAAVATARYYVGKTFGFLSNGELPFTYEKLMSDYPDFAALETWAKGDQSSESGLRGIFLREQYDSTTVSPVLIKPVDRNWAIANYETWMKQRYDVKTRTYPLYPRQALSLQGEGWLNLIDDPEQRTINNSASLVYDYWFHLGTNSQKNGFLSNFEARINYGREYGNQTEPRHDLQLILSFSR